MNSAPALCNQPGAWHRRGSSSRRRAQRTPVGVGWVLRAVGCLPGPPIRLEEPMMSSVAVDVVSDVLVLAAIDRAERHSGKDARGVPVWAVLKHLDVASRSKRAREVRVRLEALETRGSLERARRHGVPVWVLTSGGRRRLSRARRAGRVPVLPESPQ